MRRRPIRRRRFVRKAPRIMNPYKRVTYMPLMWVQMKKVFTVSNSAYNYFNFGDGSFDASFVRFDSFLDYKCPFTFKTAEQGCNDK